MIKHKLKLMWRNTCKFLIRVLEFNLKDWLYHQAYGTTQDVIDMGDRYSRI
jgi:hypothetical protein